jgi:RHS repeat-associated protein
VGNLAVYTYPNGVTSTLQYDTLNRLTSLGAQSPSGPVASYAYMLGAAGNRTGVTELSGRKVTYAYDNLYRLASETIAGSLSGVNGSLAYQYDAVGNRNSIASTLPTINTWSYSYDANDRITGFAAPLYDNDGNTVSTAGIADSYDFENHLTQHGGMTFVYDGDGNRVAKTVGGVTTAFLVDTLNPTGYAQVLDELQSGAVTRSYTWGLQQVSETQLTAAAPPASPWTTSYYGFDGHGSVRYLTDSTGAVTDTYDYDAFGNLIYSTSSTPNNYLFAGEQYDPDLGLYYNRARYLDTHLGRFWGMDTWEDESQDFEPSSFHKYLYATADPVNKIDPSGNDSVSDTLDAVTMTIVPGTVTHPLANKTFNVAAFAATLDANTTQTLMGKNAGQPKKARTSTGYCAHYVRLALAAGGFTSLPGSTDYAWNYLQILPLLGFQFIAISPDQPGYTKQKGDIAVFNLRAMSSHSSNAHKAHPAGHIEGYDGSNWVSDFIQQGFIPYGDELAAGPSRIYRYPNVSGN